MAPIARTKSSKTTTSHQSDMASNSSTTASRTGGVALKPHRPYQELPFECTYDWCQHRFAIEKEMKYHKKGAEDHYYCKKCDVDCEDWQALTAHKVEMMAPYVEGTKKPSEEDPPKHITCEFCGEDFGSFGGRKRHRAQRHPADQDIECPGCQSKFVRVANMVEHLETDKCIKIRVHQFRASINQKFIVKQMMVKPDEFTENVNRNQLTAAGEPGLITYPEDATAEDEQAGKFIKGATGQDEEEEGGGVILDQFDDDQMSGHKPLLPEVNLMGDGESFTRNSSPAWPSLQRKKTSSLADTMRGMSLSTSSRKDSIIDSDEETASQTTVTTANSNISKPSAWSSTNTSKTLFPTAKPPPVDYDAIVKRREQEIALDEGSNLFKARIFDPTSDEYRVDRFYNPTIEKYGCPFPSCDSEGIVYRTASELEEHFHLVHSRRIYSCIVCFKRFDNVAALVGHAEMSQKCGIRESRNFRSFINEITGGFLEVKEMHVPKIYRSSTDLVKAGQSMSGVMPNKYKAIKPK